jgi:hypothetical protein
MTGKKLGIAGLLYESVDIDKQKVQHPLAQESGNEARFIIIIMAIGRYGGEMILWNEERAVRKRRAGTFKATAPSPRPGLAGRRTAPCFRSAAAN